MTLEGAILLRSPIEEDAETIYALKREAFGATYLGLSIYRSPKSIQHIRHIIAVGVDLLTVAVLYGKVAGYAHAAFTEHCAVLNYIAVSKRSRSLGVGNRLLQTIETRIRERGQAYLELDVFESNPPAIQWYERCGYKLTSQSFLYQIDLARIKPGQNRIQFNPMDWRNALSEEVKIGFSKVIGSVSGGEITLGLLDGVAFKLLGYRGLTSEQAIDVAVASLGGFRSELIVSSTEAPGSGVPLVRCPERSFRMVKKL